MDQCVEALDGVGLRVTDVDLLLVDLRRLAPEGAARKEARIEAHDQQVGSYLLVDEKGALAQAKAVDEKLAAGQDLGPLAGVPVAIKDLLVTKGLATTAGSKILDGWKGDVLLENDLTAAWSPV